mmetsp:Transcript_53197/g.124619  ORF Transcript_53197/g.124619 Transcript_53197/m.124619 type:complete len:111 (+) Transcript_53197:2708-3040(+)
MALAVCGLTPTRRQMSRTFATMLSIQSKWGILTAAASPRRNERRHAAREIQARTSRRFKYPSALKQLREMGVKDSDELRILLETFDGDTNATLNRYMELHGGLADLTQVS